MIAKKRFKLSSISLSIAEIANLKGFAVAWHEAIIDMGLRGQTSKKLASEFIERMGVLCVIFSMASTKHIVSQDWQLTEHSLFYVENYADSFDLLYADGSEGECGYFEFCFSVAILASQENMLQAMAEGKTDQARLAYFYTNYLKACAEKVPSTVWDFSKVSLFLEINKHKNLDLFESQFETILEEIHEYQ